MSKNKDVEATPKVVSKPNAVEINGKDYNIPETISIELYEKIIPIIDKLDSNKGALHILRLKAHSPIHLH